MKRTAKTAAKKVVKINSLGLELREEVKSIKDKYEENRVNEIKKIKTSYLKNIQIP